MNAEQVVRDFLSSFETQGPEAASSYLAETLLVHSPDQPDAGKEEFIAQGQMILETLPDFQWNVQKATTQGNQVMVKMVWTGTHEGVFPLSAFVPGAPDIPPTGQRVSVRDTFIFTVDGNQIVDLNIASGPGEGLPEMLNQLGVQLPPM